MPLSARRVVCAFGETMAIFSPTSLLSRLDLPVFGRPAMAVVPKRKALIGSTVQLLEQVGSGLLLGALPGASRAARLQVEILHHALDLEQEVLLCARGGDHVVLGRGAALALQVFLQPGLRVL